MTIRLSRSCRPSARGLRGSAGSVLAPWCAIPLALVVSLLAGDSCRVPAWGAATPRPAYRALPMAKEFADKKEIARIKKIKDGVLRDESQLAAHKSEFDLWYIKYALRQLAQADADGSFPSANLPERRKEVLGDLRNATPVVHRQLEALLLQELPKYARSTKMPPAVRLNAMLIIGDINEVEANSVVKQKAIPSSAARKLLLQEYANPQQIDAVRVAAMVGLLRHARTAPDVLAKDSVTGSALITKEMLTLMAQAEPPAGRRADAHQWMQRLAVDTLAALGATGTDDSVAKTLQGVLNATKAPLEMRCAAASGLGRLRYATPATLDMSELASDMGRLAVACCQAEFSRIQQRLEESQAKVPGSVGFGGGGRSGGGLFGRGFEGPRRGGSEGGARRGRDDDFGGQFGQAEKAEKPSRGKKTKDAAGPALPSGQPAEPEQPPLTMAARRQLKSQLINIQHGLVGPNGKTGIALAADDAARSVVSAIASDIGQLLKQLDDEQLWEPEQLQEILQPTVDALAGRLVPRPAADSRPTDESVPADDNSEDSLDDAVSVLDGN